MGFLTGQPDEVQNHPDAWVTADFYSGREMVGSTVGDGVSGIVSGTLTETASGFSEAGWSGVLVLNVPDAHVSVFRDRVTPLANASVRLFATWWDGGDLARCRLGTVYVANRSTEVAVTASVRQCSIGLIGGVSRLADANIPRPLDLFAGQKRTAPAIAYHLAELSGLPSDIGDTVNASEADALETETPRYEFGSEQTFLGAINSVLGGFGMMAHTDRFGQFQVREPSMRGACVASITSGMVLDGVELESDFVSTGAKVSTAEGAAVAYHNGTAAAPLHVDPADPEHSVFGSHSLIVADMATDDTALAARGAEMITASIDYPTELDLELTVPLVVAAGEFVWVELPGVSAVHRVVSVSYKFPSGKILSRVRVRRVAW